MNVLLLSMPDSFEHMAPVAIRIPNGALASLAGNVDPHHHVAIADLILAQGRIGPTVAQLLHDLEPDVVGLSVMTFQRATAMKIAELIRRLRPGARIVAGGYDPSLAPDAYDVCPAIEFLVRGEGEFTFQELLRALETDRATSSIAGLSRRTDRGFAHNPMRSVATLKSANLRLPNRAARVLGGYTLLGRQVDVVETSRGCTYDCSFCSIIEMRGRNFHAYAIDRVLADIADARRHGARAIFLVDDNITLDVKRFEALCHAIIESEFNDIDYIVQGMTSPIAEHGTRLVPLMRRAGFRYVFLGIENVLESDLAFLKAAAKNTQRQAGRHVGNAAQTAISHLHHHGLYVVGGLIVGNPDDTRESIEANLAFARQYVDWPYIQHPTPYPGTPMSEDLRRRRLILDDDVASYDGTTAVVRTEQVPAREVEFMRWRAERWMKVRHMPAVCRHSPGFVLRHGLAMLAHTFAGSTLRSALGLENERTVFQRFRDRRKRERENATAVQLPEGEERKIPGMRITRIAVSLVIGAVLASLAHLHGATSLPANLSDRDFWSLTEQLSEPNGFFRSDNLLSNERGYQTVIPALLARAMPGGVYLGVGPEQNFPYIAAIKPSMAFIIDIRRGNLDEQLLYKALFEMSSDRADFMSRLFSRKRPSGLAAQPTVAELFAAYDRVQPSEDFYNENLKTVVDRLTKTHNFQLNDSDVKGLEHAYHDGFYAGGPNLNYSMGNGGGGRNSPTYEELMLATDNDGQNRGYLATDEAFRFLKTLEMNNLIVPVVGDFGGPKAIRKVGEFVKAHDGTVEAFYLSNVEQFLDQSGTWRNFCASVATLPLDGGSTYIYSGRGAPNSPPSIQFAAAGGGLQTSIRPMLEEVRNCSSAGAR